MLRRPRLLGGLLVGVGPVVDLLLDELTGVEGAEGRTREKQVVAGEDGQVALVDAVAGVDLADAGILWARVTLVIVLLREEALRVLIPGAEVVLVEDHKVPVLGAHPLVLGLEGPVPALAEEVLERSEAHDGPVLVGSLVLPGDVGVAGSCGAADELPALEVHMRLEVLLPRRLDRRLEGEDEDALEPHAAGELVRREGLAEAHLGVPEELGGAVRGLAVKEAEVPLGLLDGRELLWAHGEGVWTSPDRLGAVAHGAVGHLDVPDGTGEPLGELAGVVTLATDPHLVHEHPMHLVVHEGGAVGAHGRSRELHVVGLDAGLERGIVLVHALLDGAAGVAHLEEAGELGVAGLAVGVDDRLGARTPGKQVGGGHG